MNWGTVFWSRAGKLKRVLPKSGITFSMRKARVAILIGPKGRGSNMLALVDRLSRPEFPGELAVVVSPREDSPAAIAVRDRGFPLAVVDPKTTSQYGNRLLEVFTQTRTDFLCLAGYLRLLPAEVLASFPNRILNIHPALLPKFGGKGMYGAHVHEAVLAAGETDSGCTVHFVTENYDEGPPILQMRCPVEPDDTPETLALRVLRLEHSAFGNALENVLFEAGFGN